MDENKSSPSVEINTNIRIEDGEPAKDEAAKTETTDSAEQKNTDPKETDDVKSLLKKILGSKFFTQNDGDITNQYIFNIDSMAGGVSFVEKEKTTGAKSSEKTAHKLYERSECSAFVSEYKTSFHLAYAVAISMFEYVPVSDLQSLSERLLRRLPKTVMR